jgi:hypothetical protein
MEQDDRELACMATEYQAWLECKAEQDEYQAWLDEQEILFGEKE